MTTQMIVRIDADLKKKVTDFARAEGKNASEVVRELLQDYVKNRNIGTYIDDLWDRIEAEIARKGYKAGDVEPIIERVRAEKN